MCSITGVSAKTTVNTPYARYNFCTSKTRLEALQAEARAQEEHLENGQGAALAPADLQNWQRYHQMLAQRIAVQQDVVAQAAQAVSVQRQQLLVARQETKAIEKLCDKAKQRYLLERSSREQQLLDELALRGLAMNVSDSAPLADTMPPRRRGWRLVSYLSLVLLVPLLLGLAVILGASAPARTPLKSPALETKIPSQDAALTPREPEQFLTLKAEDIPLLQSLRERQTQWEEGEKQLANREKQLANRGGGSAPGPATDRGKTLDPRPAPQRDGGPTPGEDQF